MWFFADFFAGREEGGVLVCWCSYGEAVASCSPTVARVREGYLGKQDEKTRNLEEVASV